MLKFPYGLSDFYALRREGYFYVDRTDRIPVLEQTGKYLLFLRPRRFGKSLLLSTLENYYDLTRASEFERLFGPLAVGQQPTDLRNQYLVLKWDFSAVSAVGEAQRLEQNLYDHVNGRIQDFAVYYREWLASEIPINAHNALASFQSLLTAVRQTAHRLYLMIDEYDNFANELLMAPMGASPERYAAPVQGEGCLKALFKAVKAACAGQGLDRVFITGVSPVVLSDMTSGFNIAENISLYPEFNDLCGFQERELAQALDAIATTCRFSPAQVAEALGVMRTFYNGYAFAYDTPPGVYNPTLALYFLKNIQARCAYPREMLDSNLAMDRNKIAYISQLPGGAQVVQEALESPHGVSLARLADRFGVEDMLRAAKDHPFMVSLLYFFGVLTLTTQQTELGKLTLQIPNLVVRRLYVERLQELMLPGAGGLDEAQRAAEIVYQRGDLGPLCELLEQRYFRVFDNRDYRWANELTVKTAFLALLFNDVFYVVDSEPALARGYADGSTALTTGLTLIVRPDMRRFALLDLLLEFKYVSLGELGLSGEAARAMSGEALLALPGVAAKLAEARPQLAGYRAALQAAYGEKLRLRVFGVVAVGFERLVWQEC